MSTVMKWLKKVSGRLAIWVSPRHFRVGLMRFCRCESGVTLPLLALSLVALCGFTGMGIDLGRSQMTQSKLQASLDAAGLAAAKTGNTAVYESVATNYLNANFNGYMGSTSTSVVATHNPDNSIVTLTATTHLPTTFMNVFGIHTVTLNADTKVSRNTAHTEVVLILDNTGSMAGAKLAALKIAADQKLAQVLFGTATVNSNLYMGLVPFSQAVNVGNDKTAWLDPAFMPGLPVGTESGITHTWPASGPVFAPSGTHWKGCVEARFSPGKDISEDPPVLGDSTKLFWQYYAPCSSITTKQEDPSLKWNSTGSGCVANCTDPHATYNTVLGHCVCPGGYTSSGLPTNPTCTLTCPPNEHWVAGVCVCDGQYHLVGGLCVLQCAVAHAYYNGTDCHQCAGGYLGNGNFLCTAICGNGFTYVGGIPPCHCNGTTYNGGTACCATGNTVYGGSVCCAPGYVGNSTNTACVAVGPS